MIRPQCVKRTFIDSQQVRFAIVCGHCADKNLGTAWAELNGFIASHGICSDCLPKHFPGHFSKEDIARERAKEGIFITLQQ